MVTCWIAKGKKILLMAMLLLLFDVAIATHTGSTAAASDTPQTLKKTDEQRLLGRWVRPDGGYILELKEIGKDGTIKAAYFNPRAINVSRAEIHCKEGNCTIFIELRDVNYPGSTYSLQYEPKTDRLIGKYFQAVQRQTYDIEFVRVK